MPGVVPRLTIAELGPIARLSSDDRSEIYSAPRVFTPFGVAMVYRKYKPGVHSAVDVTVLESMPAYLDALPTSDGLELLSMARWPYRLVEDSAGTVTGFVMPAVPGRFRGATTRSSRSTDRANAEFGQLLEPGNAARFGVAPTDRDRYQLIAAAAKALSVLHRHQIFVGDLSPKSLLYSLSGDPAVFFADCDAMRFRGWSVFPQRQTPGWDAPAGEVPATLATDSYKLGLLALRLLAGDPATRDPDRLPAAVPDTVRTLVRVALRAGPAARPGPSAWAAPLTAAVSAAPPSPGPPAARPVAVPSGLAAKTPKPVRTKRRWLLPAGVGIVSAGLLAVSVIIGVTISSPQRTVPAQAPDSLPVHSLFAISVGGRPEGIAIDPATHFVYTADVDGDSVSVIDTGSRTAIANIPIAGNGSVRVAVDPGTHDAYVTEAGKNAVAVIDVAVPLSDIATRAVAATIPVGRDPEDILIDPATRLAYIADTADNAVSVIDIGTRAVVATIPVGRAPVALALDPGAHSLYTADTGDNTISVVDTSTRALVTTFPVGRQPSAVAVDTATHLAYVADTADSAVSVVDATGRLVATVPVGGRPTAVAVDPGTHTAYVVDGTETTASVAVIDTGTRTVTGVLPVGQGSDRVAVDLTGHTVYVTDRADRSVSVVVP